MKSFAAKTEEAERSWIVVDATDQPTGRLAVRIAEVLRGKDKPTFTPNADMGGFVVVVNAEKIKLSGGKDEKKIYKHYTGYSGGLRQYPAKTVREKDPTRIISQAVRGMLPKNRLSRVLMKRLKVYAGAEHPHEAQKPQQVVLL
ncbi:MAG: 50S ribosomal protein L13 [Kiritimatiellae bacterium]|nr:50S ribosomal protein L13 [Kiritimatiellia bacterium]MDD4735478.1 50S ribosomal protein L13 [Kiritimatiellia bacterium]